MDLCTLCDRCGKKIDGNSREEKITYPKTAITILLETGKAENIELCHECRRYFMKWMKGDQHEG